MKLPKLNLTERLEDASIYFDMAMEHKKKLIFVLLLCVAAIYGAYTRIPVLLSCTWTAVVVQSVPSDLWRHNALDNTCQYYNGTRWIDLKKVMDVGVGTDELEDVL
ncbi:TMhelix containing protein [Vibrio phage 1.081.O._10N.286.52.C2]|nr:TMhelix containing protein [Vibrio phage 1.081.O._10N.286.52.C2]